MTIQIVAVTLLLVSCGSVFWSFTTPVSVAMRNRPRTKADAQPVVEPEPQSTESDPSERWQQLFLHRFRRPLYDPPPDEPAPVVEKVIPPPPIRVLSTMVEPGGGFATVMDDQGNIYVLSLGATITAGGTAAKLVRIDETSVELAHEGRVLTMELHDN